MSILSHLIAYVAIHDGCISSDFPQTEQFLLFWCIYTYLQQDQDISFNCWEEGVVIALNLFDQGRRESSVDVVIGWAV